MTEYTNDFSLTFKQGTVLEFPTYSIAVPDGFEARTNVDGRDFVIYKRLDVDVAEYIRDEELLYAEIKLSHTPQEAGLLIEGDSTSNYTANIIEAMLFPFGGRGGSLRRFKTDVSVGFIEPWDTSFYITIVLNKHIFRMWLLVQDPAYFDDTEREFPEFSEKNLKDIEKMVKKWVSTIRSKESTEDDAPPQVNTERMRELEATLGDAISRALRKDAEEAMHSLPAVIEMLQGIDATHMRGVRGLSNRIQAAVRESKTLHHIGTEIDTDKSWIGVRGYAQSVRINSGETQYWICGALGDRTKYVLEELIKRAETLTEDEVYLNLLEEVDFNRQQGYEISVEGVRGAIFARRETPGIEIWKNLSEGRNEKPSVQGPAIEQAKSTSTDLRRFVQVVECANPQSWTEQKSDAAEQKHIASTVHAKPTSDDLRRFVQVVECANPQSWTEQKSDAAEQMHIVSTVHAKPTSTDLRRFVQVVECANPQSWTEQKPDAMEQMRKELAALEEATSAVTKKREAEKNKRFSALDDDLKKKLELLDKSFEDAGAEIARQIDAAKQQIAELSNNRSSLKWFDFSAKNRLKKETVAIEQRIAELERNQADNEKQHAADVRKAKSANTRKKTKIGREIELQYPMPQDTPEAIKARAERRLRRGRHS